VARQRVFGEPPGPGIGVPWVIGDACHTWIRRWDTSISHMYDCPRCTARGEFGLGGYDRDSFPQRDRYGGYLAWHALMLTAGEFLTTRPVIGDHPWYADPWTGWLAEHTLSRHDGLWLADGTDLFPAEMRRPLVLRSDPNDEASPVPVDPLALAPLVGLNERLHLGDTLIVDGDWRSTDDFEVTVRSALTGEADAHLVAVAVAAGDPSSQWLPREDGRFDWHKRDKTNSLRPWIAEQGHVELHLDRHDPYATPTALRRTWPTEDVITELKIRSDDPFKRLWLDALGAVVLSTEAWGVTGGTGQYAWSSTGTRLSCQTERLQTLLASRGARLVVLVKASKYIKGRRSDDDDAFATKTLVFWVGGRGVHPVLAIPKSVRKALGSLTQHERTELEPRLEAVRRCMASASRQKPQKV
jgi:hypothetical protein